jgi:hypothetical protein
MSIRDWRKEVLVFTRLTIEYNGANASAKRSSSKFDGGDIFFQSFNGTHWLQEPPLPKVY